MLLVVAAAAVAQQAPQRTVAAPQWQNVEQQRSRSDRPALAPAEPAVEVSVRDGYIYISSTEEVDVSVFTILGQLVATRRMQPGTVRLLLGARGVYILKAGPLTKRLNI